MSRPNIYARLQKPWLVLTWTLAIVGLLLATPFWLKISEGWLVLCLALVLMYVWLIRINPRAGLVDDKEQVKRKNKHPAYRTKK